MDDNLTNQPVQPQETNHDQSQEQQTPVQPQPEVQAPRNENQQPKEFVLPPHSNLMVWSILATIFCCLVGGIISIVYSSQSNGQYNDAMMASDSAIKQQLYYSSESKNRTAKTWLIISLIVGILSYGGYIVLASLGVLGSLSSL